MQVHGQCDQLEHQRPDQYHAAERHGHGQRIGAEHPLDIAGIEAAVGGHDGAAHQKRHDARHVKRKNNRGVALVQLQCRGLR